MACQLYGVIWAEVVYAINHALSPQLDCNQSIIVLWLKQPIIFCSIYSCCRQSDNDRTSLSGLIYSWNGENTDLARL